MELRIDWLTLILGGIIGVLASLVAAYVYDKIKYLTSNKLKISMEGLWAEYAPDSADRQYSVGRIYFDRKRKMFAFDGTNYLNSGQPYCYWKTVASYVDRDTKEFFYVFTAQIENELDKRYHGFGVVSLAADGKTLTPSRGYYVSAAVDGKPISHSMIQADELAPLPNVSGRDAIKFISRHKS